MASSPDHDRRKSVRVEPIGRVAVRIHSRSPLTQLRNISATGLAIETREPLKVGVSYLLELQFEDSPVEVIAMCIHCVPRATSTEPIFLAGFAFETLDGRARQVVTDLIDQLASVTAGER